MSSYYSAFVYGGWAWCCTWPFISVLIRFRAYFEQKRIVLSQSSYRDEERTDLGELAVGMGTRDMVSINRLSIRVRTLKSYLSLLIRIKRIELCVFHFD